MANSRFSRAAKLAAISMAVALLAALSTQTAAGRPVRPNPIGSDDFVAAQPYSGDFPDPSVMRVGSTYYAYGTTIGFLNLPTLSSTNLTRWTARSSNDPTRWWLNDAMPIAGGWAAITPRGLRNVTSTWAPMVIRSGSWFMAAYSAPTADRSKRCIGIASSQSPTGPFVDYANAVVCPLNQGAIDPYIFKFKKRTFILWKGDSDGVLYTQPLVFRNGLPTASSPVKALLSPKLPWEAGILENPAMIRYKGKLRLFYSGNDYAKGSYATGVANCKRPMGPCKRIGKNPLLRSGWGLEGTGGASPFTDPHGRLFLAYHAWRAGQTGYPSDATCRTTAIGCAQRRLYIAQLGAGKKGRIKVAKFYLSGP